MITVNNIPKNNQGIIKFPNKEIKFQILLMAKHSNVCVCLPNPILSEDKMFVCQSFTHKRKEKNLMKECWLANKQSYCKEKLKHIEIWQMTNISSLFYDN